MRGAVADVLTPTGAVIAVTAPLRDAEQRIDALGASELYVVADAGKLVGILPDYELLKRRLAGDVRSQCVSDLMSPIGVTVTCATPLAEVAVLMRSGSHRRIPVVSHGRLIGEVTRRNLLKYVRIENGGDPSGMPAGAANDNRGAGPATAPPNFLRPRISIGAGIGLRFNDSSTDSIAIGL